MSEYAKWNKYVIGEVNFIKNTEHHPHRKIFTDFVVKSCNSVVEVGPGEMLEYQTIISEKKVDYTIVDVSDVFIKNCQERYPDVRIVKCPMENITLHNVGEKKDVVYAASVIEHSKDPVLALKSMLTVAHNFHIVFFKWTYRKPLKARFYEKKGLWSSNFNMFLLLDAIRNFGEIEYCDLVTRKGKRIPFDTYEPKNKRGLHRTGDYLVVHGKSSI